MKILNLDAGIGGNRKNWGNKHEVTAVEINTEIAAVYQKFFPKDKVIVIDSKEVFKSERDFLEYLRSHFDILKKEIKRIERNRK